MVFLWKNFGILVEYRFSKESISLQRISNVWNYSNFGKFQEFCWSLTLEYFWNFYGNIYRQSFSIHFGVFLENVWNLVGIFGYVGSMRTAKRLEKFWKHDESYIRQFLGIWLEFNFGTVLEFLRKRKGNSFEIFWNRMEPFGIILETVWYSFG